MDQPRLVTVFGGAGFIGRYLVQRLAERGIRVRVALRRPEEALFLKPMGAVGQIDIVQANLRHPPSVQKAVAGADAVVNLVGLLYSKGAQSFGAVHARGAETVAKAARAAGASRFVQMSAIGADADSDSDYARSKAAGETLVAAAFPGATIVRPSVVFGPEDGFFNLFATMARFLPVMPLLGRNGATLFQPVYVADVAEALLRILLDPATAGQTYEFGGPRTYNYRELMELVLRETGRKALLIPVPAAALAIPASLASLLPKPPLTRDQLRLLQIDNVANPALPGLAALGIAPRGPEGIIDSYLFRYRRGGAKVVPRFG
jgi:NADH dehydrogenase